MEILTHEESHKRQAEMREYYADGHTTKETAVKYNTSVNYVRQICRGIRQGNQYTNGLFDREANAIRYIKERNPGFEYAGNFTGIDGFVNLKCKTCGTVTTKSFVSVRHGVARCDTCYQRKIDEYRKKKKEERKARAERDRQTRKYKKLFEMEIKQTSLKQCPICSTLFTGNRIYCSTMCQRQNKWQMKEGYRHQFPLEEVYERDDGICYLCGKPCDWNDYEEKDGVIVYGNNYPSRDHVIPKSACGLNTWDNIRLAHRLCNSLKSDSPLVENF